ncbi:hypothetical protein ACFXGA_06060 [Actinosynnema sp. NPDC059335]|uniref:hypothetical protein n=1 Tax=Actinosynnema sp. NPDC059335 TaxID=3346804 RepID=UPI00366F6EE7
MTAPDPLHTVTLTGHLTAGGRSAVGHVSIAALHQVQVPAADTVVTEQPVVVELVDGRFAEVVPLSAQPSAAEPIFLEVHVLLENTRPESMTVRVETDGETIDLADVERVTQLPQSSTVVVVPWSVVGQPHGVAPLGPDGRVPAQHLPAASGGVSAYEHVQTVPQAVVTVTHQLGYRPAVSAFSLDGGEQYDEFKVQHLSVNELRVSMDAPTACVLVMS